MKARLVVPPAILLLFACVSAYANDTAIWGVGGAIRPMQEHPSIVMEQMDLRVDVYPEVGRVRCNYVFHNTGLATVVRMGFPETVGPVRGGKRIGFLRFATAVDGRPVAARIEGGLVEGPWDTTRWRVKRVRFGAGQRRRVQVSYAAELGITLGNRNIRVFSYKIETGASWKGPIGSVRVRVFGHYDPDRNWLEVDRTFQRTGPTSFEWRARNLEPKATLEFGYYGDDIAVTSGGELVWWYGRETAGSYAYIRQGQAWLEAAMAAQAVGAAVEVRGPEVVLTRGARVVSLRPGTRTMIRNGERLTLAKAPYMRRGHLMVPLRPVATALGAAVTFDAKSRVTDVDFPSLRRSIPRDLSHLAIMFAVPRGYAPPEMSEYDPAVLAGTAQPWLCVGDFDGNGITDAALLLRQGDELRAAALLGGTPGNAVRFAWLAAGEQAPARSGSIRTALRLRKPGEVIYWSPSDARQPTGRLTLSHDGVELVAPGKPTLLAYWEAGIKRFRKVIIERPTRAQEGAG